MRASTQEQIDTYTAKGWWGTDTVDAVFRRNVTEHPDRLALVDPPNRAEFTSGEPQRLTYAELEERVRALCAPLSAAGLGPDGILAVQIPNVAELVIAYLAAARLGAIVSPLPVQFDEHALRKIVPVLRPHVYLASSRCKDKNPAWDLAAAAEGAGGTMFALGDAAPAGAVPLSHTRVEMFEAAALEHPSDANDVFSICWTSGTETEPKGVPRTHNHWFAITEGLIDGAELQSGDVILCPFPMVDLVGLVSGFFPWLRMAGTLVLHHPLDVRVFLQQIADERVTNTIAPPALLSLIVQDAELSAQADLASLRSIGSGSAPLMPEMVRAFQEKYDIAVVNFFSSNEGVALFSGRRDVPDPEERAQYFPRFGTPLTKWTSPISEMIETRLMDPIVEREIIRPGTAGEFRIRGATIFGGYFRAEALTAAAFDEDGYYRTGDVFEISGDERKYYRFIGRLTELIVRGGMNISPEELDALLIGHPQLAEAAVVGIPDEVMGKRVGVVVVPKPGITVTLEDVTDYLRKKKVAVYKLPERFAIAEALPRNPVGKVIRRALRDLL